MTPTVEKIARTDAGLASVLRVSVARLGRRLRTEQDPAVDLSVAAFSVLGALAREGELTVGQLATHERVQPPSMTRTVNCLVEDGFVVRRPHETDGRQVLVALSGAGRDAIARERRRRDAWLVHRLRELTPEEREVLRTAAPLLERLSSA
ncbi:MarR family winged helix-turn-helix transcriptional regulator [Nocardioides donggukensis]|uniref:MarR family transcriptional regulator n=1 Tax=Nocardioides donggukensis TaxID=2774019 RepID=A0A927K2B9_9ACTN|nr:MarR family transcriptional regulator [Nocardioides donggukensis]MBD8868477.1 MarR family transcriptional regulator [Nocardioides donggukensis]